MFRPVILIRLVLWSWFLGSVYVGHTLALQRLSPSVLPIVVLACTLCALYPYFRFSSFRAWVDGLEMRVLLQIHIVRFFGIFLLVLWRRGDLPYAYAVPVGFSDILMASSALFLIIAPLNKVRWRQLLTIWNVTGSLGLLLSVYIGATAGAAAPFQLRAVTSLPLSLSLTFFIPLLFATHVIIFARLLKK
jgi:hypothetical protein